MQTILDPLFSSGIFMTIAIIVILFGFVGISFLNPFKIKWVNFTYKALCYVIPFFAFMSPIFVYYGYTTSINQMMVCGDNFCFLDYDERSSESSDESVYRLNIGKIENGEKLYRKYVGSSARLLQISGNILAYESNKNCVLFDINKFKVIKEYSYEFLQTRYNEFAMGIESSTIEQYEEDGQNYTLIKVTAKDGKIWYVNPLTAKLVSGIEDKKGYNAFKITRENEITKFENPEDLYGNHFLEFARATNKSVSKQLIIGKDTSKLDFIEPAFKEIFPELNIVIIKSHTSTDKISFYISAVDFKGKLLWKHSREDILGTDYYSDIPDFDVALRNGNKLFFNSGGFIYYWDVVKDKMIWKTRF